VVNGQGGSRARCLNGQARQIHGVDKYAAIGVEIDRDNQAVAGSERRIDIGQGAHAYDLRTLERSQVGRDAAQLSALILRGYIDPAAASYTGVNEGRTIGSNRHGLRGSTVVL